MSDARENQSARSLTPDDVRKVALLSRLELTDEQASEQSRRLASVLEYVQRLQKLDLENVEPLTNPAGETNRLDPDEPTPGLDAEALMKMAPRSHPPFVTTPKTAGDVGV